MSITHIEMIFAFSIGTAMYTCSSMLANTVTQPCTEKISPRAMLSNFYKSQALKLILYTALCVSSMILMPQQGHLIVLGTAASIIYQRFFKNIKLYEQRTKYSN